MKDLFIREPTSVDENIFLKMVQDSKSLHFPWVNPPQNTEEFVSFIQRTQQPNQKTFLLFTDREIVGVFNLNEIVRGFFQNAFLGFYANIKYARQGYMQSFACYSNS